MPLPSKAERLPAALREALADLWFEQRYSLNDIVTHLSALARGERSLLPPALADAPAVPPEALPSRSGLHDHFKKVGKLVEKMRRSRMVAETLAREAGDAGDDKVAMANFQLLHTAINDVFMAASNADDDDEDAPSVAIDPKAAMMLATALEKVEGAKKKHADLRGQIRREMETEIKKKLDIAAAGGTGFDPAAAEEARRILGFV